jgi:3-hydroxyisobutyrate dehydrogenase
VQKEAVEFLNSMKRQCLSLRTQSSRVPERHVEHFIKDMGIALAEAEKMNLSLPGLGLAKQLYEAVRAQGYGRKGTQALLMALETINGVKR